MSKNSKIPHRPAELTSAQRKALRGLGHSLKPVVRIGRQGLSDGLIAAAIAALEDHELIKIAMESDCPLPRKEAPHVLAEQTGSHVAGIVGRTGLLYRRREKNPVITLPGKLIEKSSAEVSEDP